MFEVIGSSFILMFIRRSKMLFKEVGVEVVHYKGENEE